MSADTILKKYSSTIATIFTGVASAVLFGHTLTINFVLGISIVIISMHQVIYLPPCIDSIVLKFATTKIYLFINYFSVSFEPN